MRQPKKAYENPCVEIVLIDKQDIITTSGADDNPDGENWGEWDARPANME